jgi:hypothetical protein
LLLELLEERTVPSFAVTNYGAGTSPASVATADFQNAGGVDFAVANIGSNTVSVYLNHNDGSGTFQPAANYAAGSRPVDIVAGDLNGDGLPDIVVSNANSPGTLTILYNDPAHPGVFDIPPVTLSTGGNFPLDLRLADLNGDGFLDIVTANYTSNTVAVLLNNGDGTFAPAVTYAAGPGTFGAYSLAVADYYGDGTPAVAVGNFNSPQTGQVTILRGNGDGTLQPYHMVAQLPGFTSGLAAGDLGNGHMDLVSSNNDQSGVSVLLNDGAGNFTVTNYASTQPFPLRVTLADVNGDGNLDVVTDNFGTGNPGNVSVFYGNGDGTLQPGQLINSGGNQPSAAAVADVEGDSGVDGRSDLIIPNFASGNVSVLVNSPAPVIVSTTLTGPQQLGLTDAQVVFSDPIDPNTFSTNQFVLVDANGNQVNVTNVTPTDGTNMRFHVTFAPLTTVGNYTLAIGPNIMDPTDTYTVPVFRSTFNVPAPVVTSTTLTGTLPLGVADGQVVFNQPIDPNTFSTNQFVLVDPHGNPVHVSGINPTDGTNLHFHVAFDPLTTVGSYTLDIGPNITDITDTNTVAPFHNTFTVANNLIINGGFETGDLTGWNAGPGWIITQPAHSGNYAAGSGAVGTVTPLSQAITTVVGQQYTFSFWYSRVDGTPAEIHAYFGGQDVYDEVNTASHDYQFHTFTVTATSTSTIITFLGRNDPSFDLLDDVSVTPVGPAAALGGSTHVAPLGASSVFSAQSATPAHASSPAAVAASAGSAFSVQGHRPSVKSVQHAPAHSSLSALAIGQLPSVKSVQQSASTINVSRIGANSQLIDSAPATANAVTHSDAVVHHAAAADALFSDPILDDVFQVGL